MEDRIKEVIISITNRCNLRCAMCQIPELDHSAEMSAEEVRRLVMDACSLCPRTIVFSGGEPLLRKDIFDLVALVTRNKINVCLVSNGILMTDEAACRLASAGIGGVNISIEGDEKTHDSLRGKGNFLKAVEALKNLLKHRIETTISTTVSRQNYAALPHVIELANQFGATTVKFQPFSDIFLIDKRHREKFIASRELQEEINNSIGAVIRLSKEYKITTNPEGYLYRISGYLCNGLVVDASRNGCAALWSSCPVSAEGNVYPCWPLTRIVLGNVKNKKLSEIWGSRQHDKAREKIVSDGCGGCMMSCYDYNLGKYELRQLVSLKAAKFSKISFYRRTYFRAYQNVKYLFVKLFNMIRIQWRMRHFRNSQHSAELLKEIRAAREALYKKLKEIR